MLAATFGYFLHAATGFFVGFCLEGIAFSTYLVAHREGTQFGIICAAYPIAITLSYAALLYWTFRETLAFAISLGSGSALVCSGLICLFTWRRGAVPGLQVRAVAFG